MIDIFLLCMPDLTDLTNDQIGRTLLILALGKCGDGRSALAVRALPCMQMVRGGHLSVSDRFWSQVSEPNLERAFAKLKVQVRVECSNRVVLRFFIQLFNLARAPGPSNGPSNGPSSDRGAWGSRKLW